MVPFGCSFEARSVERVKPTSQLALIRELGNFKLTFAICTLKHVLFFQKLPAMLRAALQTFFRLPPSLFSGRKTIAPFGCEGLETFQNIYSMANKATITVLGKHSYKGFVLFRSGADERG